MFIKHTPKGTVITKRKGEACVCVSNLILFTQSNPLHFKVSAKRCSDDDDDDDDTIELLLGHKCHFFGHIAGNYARIPLGDITLNEEIDGIISRKEDCMEIKVGSKEARTSVRHDSGIKTLAVCIRNVRDQIIITKT